MDISYSSSRPYSAPGQTVATTLGEKSVSSLNTWNNTAFSKLCMEKSDAELEMLANNPDLGADKREIAASKLEERRGATV